MEIVNKKIGELIQKYGFQEKIYVLEGKYIITESGRVYTIYSNKKGIKEQKLREHSNGYLRATIFGEDKYVHRLVAQCFLPNGSNYPEVSHEDNNKKNNNVGNLKWCTRQYNCKKVFEDGIRTREEMALLARMPKYKSRKISCPVVQNIKELLSEGLTDTEISRITGVGRANIYNIRKGKTYVV